MVAQTSTVLCFADRAKRVAQRYVLPKPKKRTNGERGEWLSTNRVGRDVLTAVVDA